MGDIANLSKAIEERNKKLRTITVKIAEKGALLQNDSSTSFEGHMWISTDDGKSFGFAPIGNTLIGMAPGEVKYNDDNIYKTTVYERDFFLSSKQYDNMLDFVNNPEKHGFNLYYKGLTNSCVDFTWKALEKAGINNKGFEGDVFPINNVDNIANLPGETKDKLQHLIAKIKGNFYFDKEEVSKFNDYELEVEIKKQEKIMESFFDLRNNYNRIKDKRKLSAIQEGLSFHKSKYDALKEIKKKRIKKITEKYEDTNVEPSNYKNLKDKENQLLKYFIKKRKVLEKKINSSKYSSLEVFNMQSAIRAIDVALNGGDGADALNPLSISSNPGLFLKLRSHRNTIRDIKNTEQVYAKKRAIGNYNKIGYNLKKGQSYNQAVNKKARRHKDVSKDLLNDAKNIKNEKDKSKLAVEVKEHKFWGNNQPNYSQTFLINNPEVLKKRADRMKIEKRIKHENEKEFETSLFRSARENFIRIKDLGFDIKMLIYEANNIEKILLSHINSKDIHNYEKEIDYNKEFEDKKISKIEDRQLIGK